MSAGQIAFGTADLTNCDREAIHIPGSIQPHGALLVIDPQSFQILQSGGNLALLPGGSAAPGEMLADVLDAQQARQLRDALAKPAGLARPHHVFTCTAKGGSADAIAHLSEGLLVLEFEPRQGEDPDDLLGLVQEMIGQVRGAGSLSQTFQAMAGAVRRASGFDRVMVYRFLEDGTGSVDAEARADDVESYLGLRYPASDIPKQARALYQRNWVRCIPDARYSPAPLAAAPGSLPVDLSFAGLRSVSPIHLEYLANMGVQASLSLSLIVNQKLWGLIACHHRSPLFPSYRRRAALELFAQMASFHLETSLEAEMLGANLRRKTISEALVSSLTRDVGLAQGLRRFQPRLLDYIEASGVALWIDGKFSGSGKTPKPREMEQLVRWLNEQGREIPPAWRRGSRIFPRPRMIWRI